MGLLSPFLRKWRIRKASRWVQGKRILDCGCGDGSLLGIIGENVDYLGVDINEKVINEAKGRYRGANFILLNVEKGDLGRYGKFDSVVACALLEHLNNPKKFISKIVKLLSRDGRIIITTPAPISHNILGYGSTIGIFEREAFEEHKHYLIYDDFRRMAKELKLTIKHYERFQFGLNQLVVLSK
ncbi:MAG: class I SAM-dependent methyltransferase [Candidatus Micrarchaeota archaeon]|nr:class I SAM-dependent methyltransferase [Candidatus Micrarchaeota archaeon]